MSMATVTKQWTLEELHSLLDDGSPRAVLMGEALVVDGLRPLEVIRHQPKQRRRLRASGLVGAARRWRRVGDMRSETRGAPSIRVTNAESHHRIARRALPTQRLGSARLTMLAADERTRHRRIAQDRRSARSRSRC